LAAKSWLHPITGEPTQFGRSTIERWLHQARRAPVDPVGVLRRKVRSDAGQQTALVGLTLRNAQTAILFGSNSYDCHLLCRDLRITHTSGFGLMIQSGVGTGPGGDVHRVEWSRSLGHFPLPGYTYTSTME